MTQVKTHEDYKTESRVNFAKNFGILMQCMSEYAMAHKANEANNKTHGYEAKYVEVGYVDYQNRNAEWKAVDSAVNSIWDSNSDIYCDAETALAMAFSTLTYEQRKQLVILVEGFFNEDSEPDSAH